MIRSLSLKWTLILFLLLVSGLYITGEAQEMVAARLHTPELVRCIPDKATAGTELELQGYRLGWPDLKQVQVTFLQGGLQYWARPVGGGWQAANLTEGLQNMKLAVPDGLEPGVCQIIIEVNGLSSPPVEIEIGSTINPPILTDLSPHWAQPSENIWLTGTGFGIADKIEITDAKGQVYHLESDSTSSGMKASFTLPANIANGEALVRVMEQRSGGAQPSNPVSVIINNGPVPLELWPNWLPEVAPGQWLDLVVSSLKPLEKADYAEVNFIQDGEDHLVAIKGADYPRVKVPVQLSAGDLILKTRTWQKGHASIWSDPITYKIAAHPASPEIMSLEVSNINEPIYLGPSAPNTLSLYAQETLILRGRFPVEDIDDLQVVLKNGKRTLPCHLSAIDPISLKVSLPAEVTKGQWQLLVRDKEDSTIYKLPIKLQIN